MIYSSCCSICFCSSHAGNPIQTKTLNSKINLHRPNTMPHITNPTPPPLRHSPKPSVSIFLFVSLSFHSNYHLSIFSLTVLSYYYVCFVILDFDNRDSSAFKHVRTDGTFSFLCFNSFNF